MAQQLGIVFELDRVLGIDQEQFGLDIPSFYGEHSFQLPVPAVFLASKGGYGARFICRSELYETVGARDGNCMDG